MPSSNIEMHKIGWFSSGADYYAGDLLREVRSGISDGSINASIEFVFCNREKGESKSSDGFIELTEGLGNKLICLSSRNFCPHLKANPRSKALWRKEYFNEVIKVLEGYEFDVGVLAGFMLIVSAEFCNRFDLINLHPSRPEGYRGAWKDILWKTIENEDKEAGIMMHIVTEELDAGPPVTYCTFPITGGEFDSLWESMRRKRSDRSLEEIRRAEGVSEPLFRKIREEEFKREIPLLVHTLRRICEGTINIREKSIILNDRLIHGGICLNEDVEGQVGREDD